MFLTQYGGAILGPIARLLGVVINWIYEILDKIGIANIGITIILFTFVIRMLLVPSTFKQNRSTRITKHIQPEINKAIKKYKGKKDQESMLAQQNETRKIQEKYGISLTGGCLTSIINMPIFLALYNVIQNVPAYVNKVYGLYRPIADQIYGNEDAIAKLTEFQNEYNTLKAVKLDPNNINTIIDVLAKFPSEAWDKFSALFNNQGAIVDAINQNSGKITEIYSFIGGIDLTVAPGLAFTTAIIIPILSMVFQYLSMNATPMQSTGDPTQDATMKSMKTMMRVFPIMSFIICVGVPAGVGLYWAAGSLISFITTKAIHFYFNRCDMEKVVEKAKKKAAKKIAKRKAKGKKTFMERMQEAAMGEQQQQASASKNNVASTNLKSYTSNTMKKNDSDVKYREGSLAAKANLMQRYTDNNGGK
ncbi:MAG: membrane protein insertase YidC [Lachnospiraceae bacterium]|nr:membrane protein insertase YidC [Lachnospiraceae bacterium]